MHLKLQPPTDCKSPRAQRSRQRLSMILELLRLHDRYTRYLFSQPIIGTSMLRISLARAIGQARGVSRRRINHPRPLHHATAVQAQSHRLTSSQSPMPTVEDSLFTSITVGSS